METKEQITTTSLREALKTIMQKEIEKLPEYLETLDTKERVNIICKLMPFVFPRVDNVSPYQGEPIGNNWNIQD